MSFIASLKKNKVAWKAFEQFLEEEQYNQRVIFEEMRYEYQLGVFLSFFEHYGLNSTEAPGLYDLLDKLEKWKECIKTGFKELEKQLKG